MIYRPKKKKNKSAIKPFVCKLEAFNWTHEKAIAADIERDKFLNPNASPLVLGEPLMPCPYCGAKPMLLESAPYELRSERLYDYDCIRRDSVHHVLNCKKGPHGFSSPTVEVATAKWNRWCKEAELARTDGKTTADAVAHWEATQYTPVIKQEDLEPEDFNLWWELERLLKKRQDWLGLCDDGDYICVPKGERPFFENWPTHFGECTLNLPIVFFGHLFANKRRPYSERFGNYYYWEEARDILFPYLKEQFKLHNIKI